MSIVDAAREYIGTPWRHQGRLKGVGVDCVGLLVGALRDAGETVEDLSNYARAPSGQQLILELAKRFDRVYYEPWLPADILAFTWAYQPWHVGLVSKTTPLTIIHSWVNVGKVCEMPLDPSWIRRINSVWRLR